MLEEGGVAVGERTFRREQSSDYDLSHRHQQPEQSTALTDDAMEVIGRGRASAEEIPKLSPLQELVRRSTGAMPVSIASSVAVSNRMAWGQWTRSSVAKFDDYVARLFAK